MDSLYSRISTGQRWKRRGPIMRFRIVWDTMFDADASRDPRGIGERQRFRRRTGRR